MAKSSTTSTGSKGKTAAKKGPPKGVQRSGDAGTKGSGSAGLTAGPAKKGPPKGVQREGGDAGTKGTGSAGRVKSGAKRSGR